MNNSRIHFFNENISFRLRGKKFLRERLSHLIRQKGYRPGNVNIIFCSDNFLRAYNKQYLGHDHDTDVIAFDLSDDKTELSGDIYISVDRVKENASIFKAAIQTEMARVMAHGILHLTGMEDTTEALKQAMGEEENRFLSTLMIV